MKLFLGYSGKIIYKSGLFWGISFIQKLFLGYSGKVIYKSGLFWGISFIQKLFLGYSGFVFLETNRWGKMGKGDATQKHGNSIKKSGLIQE
jgi:hypothetical protein